MFRAAVPLLLLAACAAPSDPQREEPVMPPPRPLAANLPHDAHSFARPAEARVTHLSLDWTVDFGARVLRGSATLRLERTDEARELVLDTRDLQIESVTSVGSGRALEFALGDEDPILGRPLRIRLNPATRGVVVRYRTSPRATGLQWLEPAKTAGKTAPYLYSQAQAVHARSFIPCQDSPGIRVTYDATVRVPAGLVAAMSAQHLPSDEGAGVFRFQLDRAIPPYLIAIAVGDLAFRPTGPRTGVWSEPAVVDAAAEEFSDLEAMLEAIESMFGPYRWGRYDVLVLPPSFPFGGMENPLLTFATPTLLAGDKSLVNVIAHELAHSWSGNLVTNATWDDFWLNEGFTVYLERRIIERLYGDRRASQEAILGGADLEETLVELEGKGQAADTRLALDLAGRDPDDGMTDVAYEKGALFLTHLERAVGRERFDPFLRAWFDDHAFQPVTSAMFEERVRRDLLQGDAALAERLRIDAWLRDPGLPMERPEWDAAVFEAPAAAAAGFASGALKARDIDAEGWSTAEWLRFLGRLPHDLSAAQLESLDRRFALTQRGNAEVAAAWLEAAVRADYAPAYPRLEAFLTTIGRRKFLKPLYTALVQTPAGRERARAVYAKARPGYHAIATNTIDEIVGH